VYLFFISVIVFGMFPAKLSPLESSSARFETSEVLIIVSCEKKTIPMIKVITA